MPAKYLYKYQIVNISMLDLGTIPQYIKTLKTQMPNKKEYQIGAIVTETNLHFNYISENHNKMLKLIDQDKHHLLIAPEYTYNTFPSMDIKESAKYIEEIRQATSGKKALVIPGTSVYQHNGKLHNRAYPIYDGKVLINRGYQKIVDGGEMEHAYSQNLERKEGGDLGIFSHDNMKFGLEICADSGIIHRRRESIDVLLHISCGKTTPDTKPLSKEGRAIIIDGFINRAYIDIFNKKGNVVSIID
ncbi:MAG: putative amidohydrolase [Patescibacteria group bacterium]|jgi:predicted amidohydrolase